MQAETATVAVAPDLNQGAKPTALANDTSKKMTQMCIPLRSWPINVDSG